MGRRARGIVAAVAGATAVAGTAVALATAPSGSPGSGPPSQSSQPAHRSVRPAATSTTTDPHAIEVAGIVVEAPPPSGASPFAPSDGSVPVDPAPVAAAEPAPPPDPAPEPAPEPCPAFGGSGVAGVVESHRSVRCGLGLPDVALDPAMSVHAQFHAERLMAEGACANLWHSSELAAWYPGGFWGENAACMSWSKGCWSDAGRVVDGWMGSPTHGPNIVKPEYRYLGVGIACDGQRTYFVVHFRS